jgi:hypothetical protein
VQVVCEAAPRRIELRRERAEFGGEDRVVTIHDRRLQPFEQRRVALAEQAQRPAQLPAAHVEIVGDRLFDDIAPILDREIPVAPVDVEKAHVVVAVERGKTPPRRRKGIVGVGGWASRPAAALAREKHSHGPLGLDLSERVADALEDFVPVHREPPFYVDGLITDRVWMDGS